MIKDGAKHRYGEISYKIQNKTEIQNIALLRSTPICLLQFSFLFLILILINYFVQHLLTNQYPKKKKVC